MANEETSPIEPEAAAAETPVADPETNPAESVTSPAENLTTTAEPETVSAETVAAIEPEVLPPELPAEVLTETIVVAPSTDAEVDRVLDEANAMQLAADAAEVERLKAERVEAERLEALAFDQPAVDEPVERDQLDESPLSLASPTRVDKPEAGETPAVPAFDATSDDVLGLSDLVTSLPEPEGTKAGETPAVLDPTPPAAESSPAADDLLASVAASVSVPAEVLGPVEVLAVETPAVHNWDEHPDDSDAAEYLRETQRDDEQADEGETTEPESTRVGDASDENASDDSVPSYDGPRYEWPPMASNEQTEATEDKQTPPAFDWS